MTLNTQDNADDRIQKIRWKVKAHSRSEAIFLAFGQNCLPVDWIFGCLEKEYWRKEMIKIRNSYHKII